MEELTAQGNDEHLIRLRTAPGWIEVIAGSMFSGKSEELIRRLRRARIARQKVQVFKPRIDTRYSHDHIVSHSEMRHESRRLERPRRSWSASSAARRSSALTRASSSTTRWSPWANELARRGVRVIIAGLDQTTPGNLSSRCRSFWPRRVHHQTHAICVRCGHPPNYSQRTFYPRSGSPSVPAACTRPAAAAASSPTPTRPLHT